MWDDLEFQDSVKELKKAGPDGHILAHITPEEATLLKVFGGSGEIDPTTNLPSFERKYYNSFTGKWETKEERRKGMGTTQDLGNRDWKEWMESIDKWASRKQDYDNPQTSDGGYLTKDDRMDSAYGPEFSTEMDAEEFSDSDYGFEDTSWEGSTLDDSETVDDQLQDLGSEETEINDILSQVDDNFDDSGEGYGFWSDFEGDALDDEGEGWDSGGDSGGFNDSGFDSQGNYDYGSDVTGTQGMNAEDYHNMMTGGGRGSDDAQDRERRRRLAAERAEKERQRRIKAGKKKLNDLLDLKKKGYEFDEDGNEINAQYDIYMNEFQDDLEEDYALAQGGLDRSYLEGGVDEERIDDEGNPYIGKRQYGEWSGENALNLQQEGLTEFKDDTEQGNLEGQATAYQALADQDIADWYAAQQAAIEAIDSEIDWENYDFTELDLSGYDDPTEGTDEREASDPTFFEDYRHFTEDPEPEPEIETGTEDTGEAETVEVETSDVQDATPAAPETYGAPRKKKRKGSGSGTTTTSRSSSRII